MSEPLRKSGAVFFTPRALAYIETTRYICSAIINIMVSPFRRASVNCSSKYGLFLCPVGSVHTHVRRPSHTTYIRHRIAVAYPNNYFLSYGMDYVCYRNGYGGRFFVRHAITNIVMKQEVKNPARPVAIAKWAKLASFAASVITTVSLCSAQASERVLMTCMIWCAISLLTIVIPTEKGGEA